MPDPTQPPSNGASSTPEEPKRTLRETLEAAWDTVVENAPDDDGGDGDQPQQPVDNQGQPRDEHGRFVAKATEPGEAEQRPQQAEHPAPPTTPQTTEQPHPAPAQPGVAAQAPANWSAEDRSTFAALPQEGQAFLLRRHSEMEGEFQRRMQAGAQAANFAQSLAPIANDPVIAGSLREAGVSFGEAINQWAGFHKRFLTDPAGMIRELIQRARIDPAALAQMSPTGAPALPPEIAANPGLKVIADHLGRQNSDMVALRNELQAMRSEGETRQAQEVMRVTRWGIDSFAEEKDANGQPLHPHFDAVLPHIIQLFKADPRRDLREAYETALWMDGNTRTGLIQRERAAIEKQQSDARAAQAVRSNARGRTQPVSPPPRPEGQKRSLRDALEEAADAVGLE